MANIESKPIVEDKTEGETKSKSSKLWIFVGVLVFVVIASGVAFFAFPYLKGGPESSQSPSGANPKAEESQQSMHERIRATLELDPFLVNLADMENARFIKATFQLGLEEEPGEEAHNPIVTAAMRDSIISLLSSKTAQEILTPEGKDQLREEVRQRVNAISPKVRVLEVFIVDFVVQL